MGPWFHLNLCCFGSCIDAPVPDGPAVGGWDGWASLHTYAWDSTGRPVTIDSVSLTYDAFGRMVEQNRSGSYTEIAYGPG